MKGKYIFFCTFIIRNWKNTAVCGHTYLAFIGERKKPEKYDIYTKNKNAHSCLGTTKLCAYPPLSLLFKIQKGKANVGPNGSVSIIHTEINQHIFLEKNSTKNQLNYNLKTIKLC